MARQQTTALKPPPGVDLSPVVRTRKPLTDQAVVVAFQPVIQRLTEKEAVKLSSRSVQAVKHWRAGTRRIDTVSLLNLARDADPVWDFICQQAGRAPITMHGSPEAHHAYAMLRRLAMTEGPDGEAARRMLRKIGGEGG